MCIHTDVLFALKRQTVIVGS